LFLLLAVFPFRWKFDWIFLWYFALFMGAGKWFQRVEDFQAKNGHKMDPN
jgi:hypothetical protein